MLLELALIVRDAVLAEEPAANGQYRATGGSRGGVCRQLSQRQVESRKRPTAADETYPAIVKSGEGCWWIGGGNGWFGANVSR